MTGKNPFPLNRIVAFIGPYIAIASGALATWLIQHFPGLHLDKATTATAITKAVVFAIGTGVTWALHHKWLDGWQKWEALVFGAGSPATQQAGTPGAAQVAPPATTVDRAAQVASPAITVDRAAQVARPAINIDPAALAVALPVPAAAAAAVQNGAANESDGLGHANDGY